MPSRNIAVQKAVYDALRREKRPRESFTGVLRRLLAQPASLEEVAGSWGKRPTGTDARALSRLRGGSHR